MYKKAKILFFCMIFVAGGVFGQNTVLIGQLDNKIFRVNQTNKNISFHNYLIKQS